MKTTTYTGPVPSTTLVLVSAGRTTPRADVLSHVEENFTPAAGYGITRVHATHLGVLGDWVVEVNCVQF